MSVGTVETQPIEGQKPGTSGRREKVPVFTGESIDRRREPMPISFDLSCRRSDMAIALHVLQH